MIDPLVRPRIERAIPPPGTFIELDGERLHYVDRGSGPAIVMIHGLAGVLQNFTYALVDRLVDRFRVIAVDRPGSGYSRRERGRQVTLGTQASAIARLIQKLDLEQPLVVGHSLGGAVALALALDHPQRVRALGLIAPLTQIQTSPPPAFRMLEIPSPFVRALVARTIATPLAIVSGPAAAREVFAPEPVPADFGTRGGGLLTVGATAYYNASTDMMMARAEMPGLIARYRALKLPVAVLFGSEDRVLSARVHGERFALELPHVTFELVPGAGHMLPVTRPELTAEWIRRIAAVR